MSAPSRRRRYVRPGARRLSPDDRMDLAGLAVLLGTAGWVALLVNIGHVASLFGF